MGDTFVKAVRVHAWGAEPTVDDVPAPQPAEGESLVRVEAAAVAHLDLTVASGNFDLKPSLPYVGGVEGCGTVVSSDAYEAGTRVMLRGAGLGLLRGGTWAELVATPSRSLAPVPDGLPPEVGATYFVPTTTAHVALHDVGRLGGWGLDDVDDPADEIVLVAGAVGAVGSMAVQLAQRAGCTVIGLVADEAQAERLPSGVEAVSIGDVARLEELRKERPGSLLVDTLGGRDLAGRGRYVRPGGRVAVVGYVAGGDLSLDLPNWLLDDVALLPVNMMRREAVARRVAPEMARLLAAGELTLEVETFGMADAARALHLLATGGLRGRAVLVPDRDGAGR